jgi:hypothetical protein|tara:strand:+ start:533 stop:1249 length:717 start_codon:yes stop_codon:yes gene_type:complete
MKRYSISLPVNNKISGLVDSSHLNCKFDFLKVRQKKYVLIILGCFKYLDKIKKQKEGWLKHLPKEIDYFHVVGDENLEKEYVIDKEENLITLRCPDDYINLPKKTMRALEAVNKELDYDIILKTDDDQNANVEFFKNITNLINCYDANYGGFAIDIYIPHDVGIDGEHPEVTDTYREQNRYCNGRFYFLSKLAVWDLISKKEVFEQRQVEDFSIGLYLSPQVKKKSIYIPNTERWFKG